MSMGSAGKKAAEWMFDEDSKAFQMAKMEREDPEAYKKLMKANEEYRIKQRELERAQRDADRAKNVYNDNSVVTTKTEGIVLTPDMETKARKNGKIGD